jgi:quercetin dioxygenase-like cupin family protein
MRTLRLSSIGCTFGLLLVAASSLAAQGRGAQGPPPLVSPPDAEGFIIATPEAIQAARASGGRTQTLLGNQSQPGLYVVQLVWEPGQGSCPHFHTEARLINVLEGTWYVATGQASGVYNPDAMIPVHAGTFIYEPGNGWHYDMAKDVRAVVQIMGLGPVTNTSIPQPQIAQGARCGPAAPR